MGDEIPRRTLGDYSRPSHEGYQNTIELPDGNNVVPLRSDTIRLVQNGCSFHGLRSEDPNQHIKDFLKIVDSFDLNVDNRERTRLCLFQLSLRDQASNWLEYLWLLIQIFYDHVNTIDQAGCGKLRDKSDKESCALLEDLALYDNESWSDPRDFAKLVKAISMPQDVPIKKVERPMGEPPREHEAPTDIKNLEPSWVTDEIRDEEVRKNEDVGKEGEWLDIEEP
ncbi:hypothetical protein Tco_0434422 [Tanacetum coccineum]